MSACCLSCSDCFSLVSDEVDHVEPGVAVVPHIQVSVLRAVGEHCEHSTRRPQIKGHINRLSFQQVKSKCDSGVFGVGDVQDSTGDEGIARLGAGVCGVYEGRDREGLLVQLGHHDALIHTGGKDQPQAILICCQFEVGFGVVEQVGKVVVQSIVYSESVKLLGLKVISVNKQAANCYQKEWNKKKKKNNQASYAASHCLSAYLAMLEVPAI